METITLKDDNIFLISNSAGDLTNGLEGYGLYARDTRYLSRLELRLNGEVPQLLSHTTDYNIATTFRLSTNFKLQMEQLDSTIAPAWTTAAHAIGVTRRRFIKQGLVETLDFINYHTTPLTLEVSLLVGADFVDIFEVRGFPNLNQNYELANEVLCDGQVVNFTSRPKAEKAGSSRSLRFECNLKPESTRVSYTTSPLNKSSLPEMNLTYKLELLPYRPVCLEYKLTPEPQDVPESILNNQVKNWPKIDFAGELAQAHKTFSDWEQSCTRFISNHYGLNRLYETSVRDLRSLMQQQPQGLVVTAGIPWYFTLFGRDSLITSLQTLSLNPQIAIDTLRSLAAYQATDFSDWRDSEPGKILHELRLGDMTLSGNMPHGPYYGSVDSTLLFILCFAETLKWTNDPAFFAELWPAVEKAVKWAEDYGDIDKDGYIKFRRRSERGILHQGWKDSDESMGGSSGPRPYMPIALVEVQGYYYDALLSLSTTLKRYGDSKQRELATQLEARAAKLKENFNRDFWWEEAEFFAQAIDGQKNQIRNITSNPGHCLWSGIVDKDKAEKVVARLLQADMLSGWGIRTMSLQDHTYNPMSYHNGSIWPHDNALIIAGFRRYGYKNEALKVANQLLEAAATFPNYRLPELYCGFAQNEAGGRENAPAAYPVSCSPQAWAAGAGILLMQNLLGIEVDAYTNSISLDPFLPNSVETVTLLGLRSGTNRVNLEFRRNPHTGNIEANSTQQSAKDSEAVELKA